MGWEVGQPGRRTRTGLGGQDGALAPHHHQSRHPPAPYSTPAYPSLSKPAAHPPNPHPRALPSGPLAGRPSLPSPQTESAALGTPSRPSKKRFNMLLTACLPRASDVCAPRDTPALRCPPRRFPIPLSSLKPTFLLVPPTSWEERGVAPSLSQRQESPLPAQKGETVHPSPTPRASPPSPSSTQRASPALPSLLPSSPPASRQWDSET